jgi:hypothetical protein
MLVPRVYTKHKIKADVERGDRRGPHPINALVLYHDFV